MPVALVTGGSRGLGQHLAAGLLDAGWHVALTARSEDSANAAAEVIAGRAAESSRAESSGSAETSRSAEVIGIEMDVTRPESVLAGAAKLEQFADAKGLPIELVVNNAGAIESHEAAPWSVDGADWWHVIETNLRGPFNVLQAVAPKMLARSADGNVVGRIVDINSGGGALGMDDYSAYGASKAGLFRLAGAIQRHGAAHGLRIFELAPGVIQTDMTAGMPMHKGRGSADWTEPAQVVELLLAIASGELDEFSGRYLRAGTDTVQGLKQEALAGLSDDARRLRVR
ncbi:SDR family oxidoreductase [Saxibacter everestensis]|uniref:SDR family oxidoreductase n=1 Tax=Saxibacter everestensis TaxID=2909229 RepID=A0ABY8QYA2_9MICO|nr:SDR family oxidoreductase [Brevibacteriaceae bacterium ZFBP1038]